MILVTGITGLTGRFLYKELKHMFPDKKFRFLVRRNSDISWMEDKAEITIGDIVNKDEIAPSFAGVNTVVHLAPRQKLDTIISCCKEKGIKRFFYVNSSGVFSKYKKSTHSDIQNEIILKDSGLIYTIIRPTMIYGNSQDGNLKYLIKIMNKYPIFPVLGKGDGFMQPIYAGDLAKVVANALKNEELSRFKEYNVAGKEPLTYKNALLNVARALNKRVLFFHIPYSIALLAGKIGDMVPNRILTYEKVLRLTEDKTMDYQLAADELGFSPRLFIEGIMLEVDDLKMKHFIR